MTDPHPPFEGSFSSISQGYFGNAAPHTAPTPVSARHFDFAFPWFQSPRWHLHTQHPPRDPKCPVRCARQSQPRGHRAKPGECRWPPCMSRGGGGAGRAKHFAPAARTRRRRHCSTPQVLSAPRSPDQRDIYPRLLPPQRRSSREPGLHQRMLTCTSTPHHALARVNAAPPARGVLRPSPASSLTPNPKMTPCRTTRAVARACGGACVAWRGVRVHGAVDEGVREDARRWREHSAPDRTEFSSAHGVGLRLT